MDIKIINSNCIRRDYLNRIKISVEGNTFFLNEKLIDLDYQVTLSPFYKERLIKLCRDNSIEGLEALNFLLDYYYLDNAAFMKLLSKQLRYRLSLGVNKPFIIYLRTLYTIIGHFLKRLRYI